MLEEMRIRGLGVIDDAVLDLRPGLTVVTGETGAGKTMVVHGLALLTGARGDAALVRPGAERAVIEGRLLVAAGGAAAARATEAGAELDDDVLIVARTVAAEGGRSRAHVGGRAVPMAVLAEVTEPLVALHGQHDQQRVVRASEQRELLDRYAGADAATALARVRDAHERWVGAARRIAEITQRRRERAQEAELLRLGIAEVREVAPCPGEDAELAAEVARLAHVDQLRSAADVARAALTGDPSDAGGADALGLLGRARQALSGAAGLDPALDALAARLAEVAYLLADVASDVGSYAGGLDADPARLDRAQRRQSALATLTRKYADGIDAVLAWAAAAEERLAELNGDDVAVEELRTAHAATAVELAEHARRLSAVRQEAARRLAEGVTAELAALAMPDARVEVVVAQREVVDGGLVVDGRSVACSRDGVDDVELLLSAHVGAPPLPLHRGASGGELSRVMLALEVALAGSDPIPTMVFDEVDAGVGGRAAVEIGRRLAELARSHQVIVVTHLPQVAAFADHHLLVVKNSSGAVTASDVTELDEPARLRELSRMLAGLDGSAHALGHAEELRSVAAAHKADTART